MTIFEEKPSLMGIDLSQHRFFIAEADPSLKSMTKIDVAKPGASFLPSVLLPLYRGERFIAGPEASSHRRGSGYEWPVEADVGFGNNSAKGSGRVPLISAWAELSNQEWGKRSVTSALSWKPAHSSEAFNISPEEAISASLHSLAKEHSQNGRFSLVIPDNFNETSQQAILDCASRSPYKLQNISLLWRSIAMALAWSERFENTIQEPSGSAVERRELGHIITCSLGMDGFDVRTVPLYFEEKEGRKWVVPLHDPALGDGFLGSWGAELAALLVAESLKGDASARDFWREFTASDCLDRDLCNENGLNTPVSTFNKFATLESYLIDLPYLKVYQKKLSEVVSKSHSRSEIGDKISDQVQKRIEEQRKQLSEGFGRCYGVVVDGSMANFSIGAGKGLGEHIASNITYSLRDDFFVLKGQGELGAKGGARYSWALSNDCPTYYERLLPVSIHTVAKDARGDSEIKWVPLVDDTVVPGGHTYTPEIPIGGFAIAKGASELQFYLKRNSDAIVEKELAIYRSVKAVVGKEFQQTESVELKVSVSPGQGYAKVEVSSLKRGLFKCSLDWETMEEIDEPKLPPFHYQKEIFSIKPSNELWENIQYYWDDVLNKFRRGNQELLIALQGLFKNYFSKLKPSDSVLLYYGVIGSDGSLPPGVPQLKLDKFANEVEKCFQQNSNENVKQSLVHIGGFLYLSMPEDIKQYLMQKSYELPLQLTRNELFAISRSFSRKDEMGVFYRAFSKKMANSIEKSNNWLSAFRNIVRFRDNALCPNVIEREHLDSIVENIVKILTIEIQGNNLKIKFNNTLISLFFTLKRRRYEPDFLSVKDGDRNAADLCELLKHASRKHSCKKKYREMIAVLNNFLNMETNQDDIDKALQYLGELC